MYASVLHDVLRGLVDQAELECMSFHPLLAVSNLHIGRHSMGRAYAERYFDAFFQDILEVASLLVLALCPRIGESCELI